MAVLRPGPAQAAGFREKLPVRALIHLRRDTGHQRNPGQGQAIPDRRRQQ